MATEADLEAEGQATRAGDLRWALEDPRGRRLLREVLYHPERGLGLDTMPSGLPDAQAQAEAAVRARAKAIDDRIQRLDAQLWLLMHAEYLEARDEAQHLRDTAAEAPPDDDGDPDP